MDFPHFDGINVRIWLDKCLAYFHIYTIPPDFRVTTASLHMTDKVAHWFQSYKHSTGSHTWEHFAIEVSREFEAKTHRVKTMALLNLRQLVQLKITSISLIIWSITLGCVTRV
jgi:hypothetical protein